jgi:hypothetical protein
MRNLWQDIATAREKAKPLYEKLILINEDSIYFVEARKT